MAVVLLVVAAVVAVVAVAAAASAVAVAVAVALAAVAGVVGVVALVARVVAVRHEAVAVFAAAAKHSASRSFDFFLLSSCSRIWLNTTFSIVSGILYHS